MTLRQSGFTLIELIVVIVILGTLAAFALPKFADLDERARAAVVNGLAGSIRSSSALAHGLSLANKNPGYVVMEGTSIFMTYKYPQSNSILNTISDPSGFDQANVAGSSSIRFFPLGLAEGSSQTCYVEYNQPTTKNGVPFIDLVDDSCA